MQGGAIHLAVNGDAGDPQVAAGAQNANRDLPAIGDEQLSEHTPAAERACILALQQGVTQAWECAGRGKFFFGFPALNNEAADLGVVRCQSSYLA
jgi:hypothetical protein